MKLIGSLVGITLAGLLTSSNPTSGGDNTPEQNPATGTAYRGVQQCDATQIKVSFLFDEKESTIRGFESMRSCVQGGEGGVSWKTEDAIRVAREGAFTYKDRYGNSVRGKIDAGKASGTLEPAFGFNIKCGDKFLPICTKWTAEPVK